MAKTSVGDIRPVYQQVGWEVCKETGSAPEEEKWTPTEKESESEILSDIYKKNKKEE